MGEGAIDRSGSLLRVVSCRVVSESAAFFPIFCRVVSDSPDLHIKQTHFSEMSAKVHVGADDDVATVRLQPPELPTAANDDGGGGGTGCDDQGGGVEEFAKCDCCGLTEECTPAYAAGIRGRYGGRWICGLCSEAVEEEILRSDGPITTAEALDRHMSFSRSFRPTTTKPPPDPKEHLISAMRQLLRRSLDSPRAMRSTPSSPRRGGGGDEAGDGGGGGGGVRRPLGRSGSCFSSIGG